MKVDYIALSVPIFFLLIGVELIYTYFKKLHYYRLNDAISNISQGIGQQLSGIFMKTALFFGYFYIYTHWKIWEVPVTWWSWIILFIGVDFFYYWFHRASHEINALWAAHIVHHQSEEYNLTVALRQSWFQGWFSWIFYLPLAVIGFEPIMFLTMTAFNTLYQFWIHTKAIKTMGFLEYVINTPSHHRVHHGTNPKYIDRNHGGTLIIWDRLFGTFQQEEEEVQYGITKPLNSWNPFWANFHHWADMINMARKTPNLHNKIKIFFQAPGWVPSDYQGDREYSAFDPDNKYDRKGPSGFMWYGVFQFLLALTAGTYVLNNYASWEWVTAFAAAMFVLSTLVTSGAVFDQSHWLFPYEVARILLSFSLFFLWDITSIPGWMVLVFVVLQVGSFLWILSLKNSTNEAQSV